MIKKLFPNLFGCLFALVGLYEIANGRILFSLLAGGIAGLWLVANEIINKLNM